MTHTRAIDRLLRVPHVVEEVFIQVVAERPPKSGASPMYLGSNIYEYNTQASKDRRRTLACSARACKAFVEPALDTLWRELGDLLVLLRIHPSLKPYTSQSMVS